MCYLNVILLHSNNYYHNCFTTSYLFLNQKTKFANRYVLAKRSIILCTTFNIMDLWMYKIAKKVNRFRSIWHMVQLVSLKINLNKETNFKAESNLCCLIVYNNRSNIFIEWKWSIRYWAVFVMGSHPFLLIKTPLFLLWRVWGHFVWCDTVIIINNDNRNGNKKLITTATRITS